MLIWRLLEEWLIANYSKNSNVKKDSLAAPFSCSLFCFLRRPQNRRTAFAGASKKTSARPSQRIVKMETVTLKDFRNEAERDRSSVRRSAIFWGFLD
jgi:hypothetical protein